MTTYKWTITLHTTSPTAPAASDVQSAMDNLFNTTATNVALAGPQSVDDGPADEESD